MLVQTGGNKALHQQMEKKNTAQSFSIFVLTFLIPSIKLVSKVNL